MNQSINIEVVISPILLLNKSFKFNYKISVKTASGG